MRTLTIVGGAAALLFATSAQAENFTYEVAFTAVEFTGGVGPDGTNGRGGNNGGTMRAINEDGTEVTGTVSCVGMDINNNAPFNLRLACDAESESGSSSSAYLCVAGENGVRCVGAISAKSGPMEGRGGLLTMSIATDGNATGTGQWFEAE